MAAQPKFEIVPEADGDEWFWRLVDSNGETIATSLGETFTRAEDAERSALAVIEAAPLAMIVRVERE